MYLLVSPTVLCGSISLNVSPCLSNYSLCLHVFLCVSNCTLHLSASVWQSTRFKVCLNVCMAEKCVCFSNLILTTFFLCLDVSAVPIYVSVYVYMISALCSYVRYIVIDDELSYTCYIIVQVRQKLYELYTSITQITSITSFPSITPFSKITPTLSPIPPSSRSCIGLGFIFKEKEFRLVCSTSHSMSVKDRNFL